MERREVRKKMESNNELTDAITALRELNKKPDAEIREMMLHHGPQFKALLNLMGSLINTSCGNINKIYEKSAALAIQERDKEDNVVVTHVKNSYGPDIRIKKRIGNDEKEEEEESCIDVKTSVVYAKDGHTSDWCISLNTTERAVLKAYTRSLHEPGATKELQKKFFRLLAEELTKKVANGYMLFVACCGEEMINEYELDGRFIVLYTIQKLVTSACTSINLGSKRCSICFEYHRMRNLIQWAGKLEIRLKEKPDMDPLDKDCFDPTEWKLILNSRVQSQCRPLEK